MALDAQTNEVEMGLSTVKDLLGAVESVITSVALLAAGFWTYLLFVRRRQKFPRARLSHNMSTKLISHDKRLIRVTTKVENTGEVLLELAAGEIRLEQVLPLSEGVLAAAQAGEDPVVEGEAEIEWECLGIRYFKWGRGEWEVEPSEEEEIHADFVIDSAVQTIQVYSYLKNQSKEVGKILKRLQWRLRRERGEIGWRIMESLDLPPPTN